MSVLVKGMDMPDCCDNCKLRRWDDFEEDWFCPFSGIVTLCLGRQNDCPLVEIPDKHGDLIDASQVVHATYYDDEKETWNVKVGTVEDVLTSCIDEELQVVIGTESKTEGE